jgi:DnaK suppressor protein
LELKFSAQTPIGEVFIFCGLFKQGGVLAKLSVVKNQTSEKSTTTNLTSTKGASTPKAKVAAPALKITPAPVRPSLSRDITAALISECRERLLLNKAELMNRIKDTRGKLDQFERGGDEADQTMRILAEQEMLNLTDRLRHQLLEIESALGRIENGSFGYCEETEEAIEVERLRALPWTRLSIEGAEIRESMTKRYAKG